MLRQVVLVLFVLLAPVAAAQSEPVETSLAVIDIHHPDPPLRGEAGVHTVRLKLKVHGPTAASEIEVAPVDVPEVPGWSVRFDPPAVRLDMATPQGGATQEGLAVFHLHAKPDPRVTGAQARMLSVTFRAEATQSTQASDVQVDFPLEVAVDRRLDFVAPPEGIEMRPDEEARVDVTIANVGNVPLVLDVEAFVDAREPCVVTAPERVALAYEEEGQPSMAEFVVAAECVAGSKPEALVVRLLGRTPDEPEDAAPVRHELRVPVAFHEPTVERNATPWASGVALLVSMGALAAASRRRRR